jgi:hypothetical protein
LGRRGGDSGWRRTPVLWKQEKLAAASAA